MNINSSNFKEQQPVKCHSCKSFYGSEAFKGLCSSCYKKTGLQVQSKSDKSLNEKVNSISPIGSVQINERKDSIQTQPQDTKETSVKEQMKIKQVELKKQQVKSQPNSQKLQLKIQEKLQIPSSKQTQKVIQTDRKRCFNCKKKIGLLGIQCKCGYVYCNSHRLPEQHSCGYNHQQVAKQRLKNALIKIYNGKIEGI